MNETLERIIKEHEELKFKIRKLMFFVNSEMESLEISGEHQLLLKMQLETMEMYLCILEKRIKLLEENK